MVQIFQQGIEGVGDFGQLRVLNFKSHRVAQTPHLLFGQFLHTSLPWLEERNAPDAMVIYSEKGADRYGTNGDDLPRFEVIVEG
jgi:hypothetical protein